MRHQEQAAISASILMVAGNAMASMSADHKLGIDFESPSDEMRAEVGALFNTKEGNDAMAVARDSCCRRCKTDPLTPK